MQIICAEKRNRMTDLNNMGQNAAAAKYKLQMSTTEEKNNALRKVAESLIGATETILAANAVDIQNGENAGMHPGMIDRLRLTDARIKAMAEG